LSQFAGISVQDWLTAGTAARVAYDRETRLSTPVAGTVEELEALAMIDAARDDELLALTAPPSPRQRERAWKPRERHLRGW